MVVCWWKRTRHANQRFAKRKVHMARSTVHTNRCRECITSDGTPLRRFCIISQSRINELADKSSIQMRLVNCLRCTNTLQLWRAVGCTYEKWNVRIISLDHSREKLCRRRSRRAEQNSRNSRVQANSQCGKRCRTLIMKNMQRNFRMTCQRNGHWRTP